MGFSRVSGFQSDDDDDDDDDAFQIELQFSTSRSVVQQSRVSIL